MTRTERARWPRHAQSAPLLLLLGVAASLAGGCATWPQSPPGCPWRDRVACRRCLHSSPRHVYETAAPPGKRCVLRGLRLDAHLPVWANGLGALRFGMTAREVNASGFCEVARPLPHETTLCHTRSLPGTRGELTLRFDGGRLVGLRLLIYSGTSDLAWRAAVERSYRTLHRLYPQRRSLYEAQRRTLSRAYRETRNALAHDQRRWSYHLTLTSRRPHPRITLRVGRGGEPPIYRVELELQRCPVEYPTWGLRTR